MSDIKYFLRKDGDCERPALMWGWGNRLEDDNIVHQIHEFKKAGIEEFYIHPSWTSEYDDYLSDYFMDKIELAFKTAESLGIKYSIYDEYDWASGVCAGKVIIDHPEYRMRTFRWFSATPQAGEPCVIWFKGKLLAVQVQYTDKQGKREDITDQVEIKLIEGEEGGIVRWRNENTCTTRVFVFTSYVLDIEDGFSCACKWSSFTNECIPGFTETMNPDAVKYFLEINNDRYRERLGENFGKSIRRVFTDETSLSTLFCDSSTRPYSSNIEDEFFKDHGYKLSDNYIALAEISDSDHDLKVRHDYYSTCTRAFTTYYLQQYADWCHKNNLLLTGHMSGEGVLHYQTVQMGDFYEALSKFDVPGIDNILSKLFVEDIGFGITDSKLLASVAKFTGKDHTMCETFTGSGWDFNLEDGKRIMNKLMMVGINYTIYMSAFYSMNGASRTFPLGYPPSHGFNNPLFKHYGALSDYAAIRSSLLSKTKNRGSTLLFIPQIDCWTHLEDWRANGKRDTVWHECATALTLNNVEYDIFFEPLAKETEVKNGKICVKGYEYDTIILPPTRCSNQAALDMLAEFAKQGGHIAFVDAIPTIAADTGKKYDFAEICGLKDASSTINANKDGEKVWEHGNSQMFLDNNKDEYAVWENDRIQLINTAKSVFDCRQQLWSDLSRFAKAGSPEECIGGIELPEGVTISRRTAEGLYCCLVYNDTTETKTVKLRINSSDKLTLLKGIELYDCEAEEGCVTLEVASHDMQIIILTAEGVSIEGIKGEEESTPEGEKKELTLDSGWTFTTKSKNMLPIKVRYLTKAEPCGKLSDEIYEMAKTADNPFAVQEFPAGEGITFGDGYAAYARFEIEGIPDDLEIFTEIVDDDEVWLNGHLLSGYKKVYERGPRDKVTDIAKYAKVGTNVIVVFGRIPAWRAPHQMGALVVRGTFCINEKGAIAKYSNAIDINKYYTQQGLRYYYGDLSWHNTFVLDTDKAKKISIKLELKEVAEVIVNGVSAGTRYWQPYELDITGLCKQGENTVEILCTTTSDPTMVLEEVVLLYQGVSEYRDEVKPQPVGMNTPPVITIIE